STSEFAVKRFVNHQQLLAVRVRKRPEQELIDDGEDCRVAADTERQNEHDRDSEPWTLPQATRHVPDISSEILEPACRPDVVPLFLQPKSVPKTRACRSLRVSVAHSRAHVLARDRFEMRSHPLVHIVLASAP